MFIKIFIPENQVIEFFKANGYEIEIRELPYSSTSTTCRGFSDVPVLLAPNDKVIRLDRLMNSLATNLTKEIVNEGEDKATQDIINSFIKKFPL